MTLEHFSRSRGRTLGTGFIFMSNPLSLGILPSTLFSGVKSARAAGTMTMSWFTSSSIPMRSLTEAYLRMGM